MLSLQSRPIKMEVAPNLYLQIVQFIFFLLNLIASNSCHHKFGDCDLNRNFYMTFLLYNNDFIS